MAFSQNKALDTNVNVDIRHVPGMDLDTVKSESRARVLIVDDDLDFIEMLKIVLRNAGFDVAGAPDSDSALAKCTEINPDVILLDLMIPGVDGWGIYQILREITRAPVIVVSASGNQDNVVRSLEMGVYDYISKPFYNPEIIARINRVLQQVEQTGPMKVMVFPSEDLRIDYEAHEIVLRGKTLHLRPREFKLLSILAESAPKNVSYEVLTKKLWEEDNAKTRSHLKNIAFALRQKMEETPASPKLIVNYRSIGYQLNARKKGSTK